MCVLIDKAILFIMFALCFVTSKAFPRIDPCIRPHNPRRQTLSFCVSLKIRISCKDPQRPFGFGIVSLLTRFLRQPYGVLTAIDVLVTVSEALFSPRERSVHLVPDL